MVDKLLLADQDCSLSSFKIPPDNVFCENGFFYEGGMIENIAQSVAAGAGYQYVKNSKKPPLGVIGSIKKLKIVSRPKIGETILTEVKFVASFENAMVVEGFISLNDRIIAQCQMNIFILKEIDPLNL